MELKNDDIAQRLMAAAGSAKSWDEVMISVALIRAAAQRLWPVVDLESVEDLRQFVCAFDMQSGDLLLAVHQRAASASAARIAELSTAVVEWKGRHADAADRIVELGAKYVDQTRRIAELEAENARLAAEVEALRKRVLPEGWRAVPERLTYRMKRVGRQFGYHEQHVQWAALLEAAPPLPIEAVAAAPAAPVSASPQQAAPAELTDDQIEAIFEKCTDSDGYPPVVGFARAVLAASHQPDDLRAAVRNMVASLRNGEWAEDLTLTGDAADLQSVITKLVGEDASHQAAAGAEGADGWHANKGWAPVIEAELRDGSILVVGMKSCLDWEVAGENEPSDIIRARLSFAAPSTSQPAREGE
jgi:hypothetical protein